MEDVAATAHLSYDRTAGESSDVDGGGAAWRENVKEEVRL